MDTMAEIRATFFEECDEQLKELGDALALIERDEGDAETVNTAYRAVHSIKGGAAAFDLHELSGYAKTFEGLLGEIRAERQQMTADAVSLIRRSADALARLSAASRETSGLTEELKTMTALTKPEAAAEPVRPAGADEGADLMAEFGFTPVAIDLDDLGGEKHFRVTFRPQAELYQRANESARLLRDLCELGRAEVRCDAAAIPLLGELKPEESYLSWSIDLHTEAGEAGIRQVFEFAEWDCDLDVEEIVEAGDAADALGGVEDPEMAALLARMQAEAVN
ncbi:Hpt domain-containing protein [Aurantimonas sp. MSK8Z-1]|uniref:Hpt domain-containing protein n=1 Tax=Mangrovibrevibacter kandeliae TaxID=2968473 RepID=UPI002118B370|nr:Hpt domain-containing protein [Aurantimonas sp. MSK8Z-1]MCW4116794.1 Hpt domain-containing protein [Aurantimonas sp. MSK8Z-1]